MSRNQGNRYRQTVYAIVCNSPAPISIESVRKKAEIKSWVTAKSILLELLLQGQIFGLKSDKSWVFGNRNTMTAIHAVRLLNNRKQHMRPKGTQ